MKSIELAGQVVHRFGSRLHKCITEAWHRVNALLRQDTEVALAISPSARAHLVNNILVSLVKKEFVPEVVSGGVEFKHDLGFLVMNIEGKVLLRFKKFGSDGLPHNYRTSQQRYVVTATKSLFGLEEVGVPLLYAGYSTDELQLRSVEMKRLVRGKVDWALPIRADTLTTNVIGLAASDSGQDEHKPKKRAKKKQRKKDDKRRGGAA